MLIKNKADFEFIQVIIIIDEVFRIIVVYKKSLLSTPRLFLVIYDKCFLSHNSNMSYSGMRFTVNIGKE